MAAERLYYDDPLQLSFRARVTGRRWVEGRPAIALDRTAFYPTSGGQPHDRGQIAGVAVIDVREEGGEVWHILAGEVAGEAVSAEVERERRFDHMQQHTGQHILSQTFEGLLGAATISFHLGEEACTIDLDRTGLDLEGLSQVEDRANAIVFEDRPVIARFVAAEELARMPLRKPPAGHERVRVVEVEGYDWSPCGGTHCRRSGQVGLIRITHSERHGEETRVTFLCGWRAVQDARWKHNLLAALAAPLSVGIPDLPATVARLAAAEGEARKALEQVHKRLLHAEAVELYQRGEPAGPARVVRAVLPDRSPEELRALAREIAGLPGGVALLGTGGDSARLCFAREEGLPYDMAVLVREAAGVIGGRGGGRPHEAQGGGPEASRLQEALQQAHEHLRER